MNFMDALVNVNGNDVTLTVGEHVLKVPASKKQALIDGDYDGKLLFLVFVLKMYMIHRHLSATLLTA